MYDIECIGQRRYAGYHFPISDFISLTWNQSHKRPSGSCWQHELHLPRQAHQPAVGRNWNAKQRQIQKVVGCIPSLPTLRVILSLSTYESFITLKWFNMWLLYFQGVRGVHGAVRARQREGEDDELAPDEPRRQGRIHMLNSEFKMCQDTIPYENFGPRTS